MYEIDFSVSQEQAIEMAVERYDYILCCITYKFSSFKYYKKAEEALNKGKKIIPILFNEVDMQELFFKDLKILPSNKKAIANWDNHDAAFTDIARELRKFIDNL